MKNFVVEMVNLNAGKIFYLPTTFADRAEACVGGQNYVRDRQGENHDLIFFRVLDSSSVKNFNPGYFNIEWFEEEKVSSNHEEDEFDPVSINRDILDKLNVCRLPDNY